MPIGVVIITHGSKRKEANDEMRSLVNMIRERDLANLYQTAFLQFEQPALGAAVDQLLSTGVQTIVVMPYFLVTGNHLSIDIMGLIKDEQEKHPDIKFMVARHLGMHPGLVDIVLDRIGECI
ncbi:MAG: CbiX/SirB N-terminal domain-containing protein [Syntrophomonadaceae bacterium]